MKMLINACDKGAGIKVLNFCDYLDSCLNHLKSQQKQPDGTYKNYYSEVDENDLKDAKNKIKDTLQTALDLEIIQSVSHHSTFSFGM